MLLGVAFFCSGLVLITVMSKHFNKFFIKVKNKLYIATVALSLSLFVRGVINLTRYLDETELHQFIINSRKYNTVGAPIFNSLMFLVSDCIPIVTQLFTMIFGFVR